MPCSIILSNHFLLGTKLQQSMRWRGGLFTTTGFQKKRLFLDFTSASLVTVIIVVTQSWLCYIRYKSKYSRPWKNSDRWPNHASSFSCSFVSLDSSSLVSSLSDSFDTVNKLTGKNNVKLFFSVEYWNMDFHTWTADSVKRCKIWSSLSCALIELYWKETLIA